MSSPVTRSRSRQRRSASSDPATSHGVNLSDSCREMCDNNTRHKLSASVATTIVSPSITATPSVKSRIQYMVARDFTNHVSRELHTSPGLAKLRMTPGGTLKAKQKVLVDKHESARRQADQLHVGGGVSLWPEMDDMRLGGREVTQLGIFSCVLMFLVVGMFLKLHGVVIAKLNFFHKHLMEFATRHPIILDNQEVFVTSSMYWHEHYRKLLYEMHESFDVSHPSSSYQLYIFLYLASLAVLLFYLIDNMLSANKLSPRRIKTWVSLLVVVGVWSVMMMYLLVKAQAVETMIETNVHKLSERLGDILQTDLGRDKFESVLLYWHTRCLPPMTRGTLNILGLLPVRDVSHYLQYYSVPVVTLLVTPPAKLIVSLYRLYVPPSLDVVTMVESNKLD